MHKTGRVAQSAEHRANNARVVSSSLTVTINFSSTIGPISLFHFIFYLLPDPVS